MFRNHVGPFPPLRVGSKRKNEKSPIENDTKIKLCRKGIWQFNFPDLAFNESEFRESRTNPEKFKEPTFDSMDAAFDILENECSFLPDEIKQILKECLEPLYIKVDFCGCSGGGRRASALFWIYDQTEWKMFAKIYKNWFCQEYQVEYLEKYRFIWGIMAEDKTINSRSNFRREMHTNTERVVKSKLAPDFRHYRECASFFEHRSEEEELQNKRHDNCAEFNGAPPKKKKRRLERVHPTGVLFEVDTD